MNSYSSNIKDRVSFVCKKLIEEGFEVDSKIPGERKLAESTGVSKSKLREVFAVLDYIGVTQSNHGKSRVLKGDITKLV